MSPYNDDGLEELDDEELDEEEDEEEEDKEDDYGDGNDSY